MEILVVFSLMGNGVMTVVVVMLYGRIRHLEGIVEGRTAKAGVNGDD